MNEAARLEGLCKVLGKPILISKSFAQAAGGVREPLLSVGRHPLRGVREAHEVGMRSREKQAAHVSVGAATHLSRLWVVAHVVEWTLRPTSIVVTTSAATRSGHTLSRSRMLHRVRHHCLRPTSSFISISIDGVV